MQVVLVLGCPLCPLNGFFQGKSNPKAFAGLEVFQRHKIGVFEFILLEILGIGITKVCQLCYSALFVVYGILHPIEKLLSLNREISQPSDTFRPNWSLVENCLVFKITSGMLVFLLWVLGLGFCFVCFFNISESGQQNLEAAKQQKNFGEWGLFSGLKNCFHPMFDLLSRFRPT